MPTIIRLLDTDIVIDIQKGKPSALAWFTTQRISEIGSPSFAIPTGAGDAKTMGEIALILALLWRH